ncbi:hypothetical protein BT93_H0674 [Corymbia citriodora subsp. variegata]|nr:hypothetical protein BT93_H0674 [Corymbia citriodora subsp. variegata]
MDSHGECSTLESLGGCEASPERGSRSDRSDIRNNGSCDNIDLDGSGTDENFDAGALTPDSIEKGKQIAELNTSPPSTAHSPSGGTSSTRKGYGLKKWRRIRRDFVKDGSAQLDSSKILKRGLNGLGNQNNSPRFSVERVSVEVMKDSEGSVGSTSMPRNLGHADGPAVHASTLESTFAAAPAFTAGADSDNSEERSSRSSTAASAPKAKHDFSAAFGYVRERNRMKNLSGKSQGGSSQHAQQNKGRIEISKKPRGERVKIQKENSHSSVESDLRSSSSVFMQGAYASNGKKSGRAMNYYSANSDEAHMGDHFTEEVQTGYPAENVGEAEDFSQDDSAVDLSWDAGEEKHRSNRSPADPGTLIESINALQSLQEALEQEVQKFSEIGRDPIIGSNGSSNGGTVLQEQSNSKQINQKASGSLEIQILSLTENVKHLEAKLEETRTELKVKESRVSELEDSLNSHKPVKEEPESTLQLQREERREMEAEIEGLFKQKIEAEVEYLAIARTIQKLKVDAQSQLMLLSEGDDQRASESEAESKAAALKKQADDLVKACEEIEVVGEVWKLQRGACKVSSCFVIQLVLFVLVFWWFIMQISPQAGEVVPT